MPIYDVVFKDPDDSVSLTHNMFCFSDEQAMVWCHGVMALSTSAERHAAAEVREGARVVGKLP